jgi:ABC-type phosphate transport system substrate-binding protein
MTRLEFNRVLCALLLAGCSLAQAADRAVVVIGHASVRKLDQAALQRIFTGKTIELDGVRVQPINAAPGTPVRQRFLSQYLQTDEDQYVGYWTVRRYVGKGTPPPEVRQAAEMIELVGKTPGAIGYIDEADLQPGLNVLLRK